MKVENMCWEVIDCIVDAYKDDGEEGTELVKDILRYLYETTTDNKLKFKIEEWFDEEHYCVDCGSKLELYEYQETHTELDGNPIEYLSEYICPLCDR